MAASGPSGQHPAKIPNASPRILWLPGSPNVIFVKRVQVDKFSSIYPRISQKWLFCNHKGDEVICLYCGTKLDKFVFGVDIELQHRLNATRECQLLLRWECERVSFNRGLAVTNSKHKEEVKELEEKLSKSQALVEKLSKEKKSTDFLNTRIEQLEFDLDLLQEDINCRVCFVNPSSVLLFPCLHLSCCSGCMRKLKSNCPLCRKQVSGKVKIFRSLIQDGAVPNSRLFGFSRNPDLC